MMIKKRTINTITRGDNIQLSKKDFESIFTVLDELDEKNLQLIKENELLKEELKIYRRIANCSNCYYHNYDWFDDGDEFEVCDKGNDVSNRICENWEEL